MDLLLCTLYILNISMLIVIVEARVYNRDTCDNDAMDFWKEKFNENYSGSDTPEKRCEKEDGFCLRDHEDCPSNDHVRYQTQCYNRCDCCLRKERKDKKSSDWILVKRRLKWESASDYCREMFDADLLVPENIAYVIEYLRDENMDATDVWIGVNDAHRGKLEGIHGNEIEGGWQRGQPKREEDRGDNCVVVEDDEFDGSGMKVEPCYANNYFICDEDEEHRRDQHPVMYDEDKLEDDGDDGSEEEDFGSDLEQYYGTGVKIFGSRKTWNESRKDCQRRGGDLLVPESVSTFIKYMKKEGVGARDVWIGYNDQYYEEEFEGVHGNIIESGWQPGEPRYIEPGEDCVVIEDDSRDGEGLKVEPCHEEHIYACDLTDDFESDHKTRE